MFENQDKEQNKTSAEYNVCFLWHWEQLGAVNCLLLQVLFQCYNEEQNKEMVLFIWYIVVEP